MRGFSSDSFTHLDSKGQPNMVSVSSKQPSARKAVAFARIRVGEAAFKAIQSNQVAKGNVLTISQLAGIMAAKDTPRIIPLCHGINLDTVKVRAKLEPDSASVKVLCEARCEGKTGVEMEAMVGASVAALTVYDMCKAFGKAMVIEDVRLLTKEGGKSGTFMAEGAEEVLRDMNDD